MIIWIVFFIVIISISLFLAIRSMRDYAEMPIHSDTLYSLYLIKNKAALTEQVLESIDQTINQKRLVVSFERLYKGSKQALVVYGPVVILKQYIGVLDLVELEDYSINYSDPLPDGILSWEISSSDLHKTDKPVLNLTDDQLTLADSEELWWQLIIQPKCKKDGLQPLFKALIRVVIIAQNGNRATDFKSKLDLLIKNTNLVSVPQAFSTAQIVEFYQKRSLPQKLLDKEGGYFIVTSEDIRDLLA